MAVIRKIKNGDNTIYPITHADAIFDNNGKFLTGGGVLSFIAGPDDNPVSDKYLEYLGSADQIVSSITILCLNNKKVANYAVNENSSIDAFNDVDIDINSGILRIEQNGPDSYYLNFFPIGGNCLSLNGYRYEIFQGPLTKTQLDNESYLKTWKLLNHTPNCYKLEDSIPIALWGRNKGKVYRRILEKDFLYTTTTLKLVCDNQVWRWNSNTNSFQTTSGSLPGAEGYVDGTFNFWDVPAKGILEHKFMVTAYYANENQIIPDEEPFTICYGQKQLKEFLENWWPGSKTHIRIIAIQEYYSLFE